MGWQDLIMFTIQVDDHNAKIKDANKKIEAKNTQQNWQRM